LRFKLLTSQPRACSFKLEAIVVLPHRLAVAMEELYAAGIPCSAYVDRRIDVWLGDQDAGPMAHASFAAWNAAGAARWLRQNATRLFQLGEHARRRRRRFTIPGLLALLWRPF
jgi:hypothetical protein